MYTAYQKMDPLAGVRQCWCRFGCAFAHGLAALDAKTRAVEDNLWLPGHRGPRASRRIRPREWTRLRRLCGLIYAAVRQARIKVWEAMVAADLVGRPQKV